jgi:hypothetical protein
MSNTVTIQQIRDKVKNKLPLTKAEATRLARYEGAGITFNRENHAASLLQMYDYGKMSPEERRALFAQRRARH